MKLKTHDQEGLFKNIFTAYFILLLHVFLLAGIGITVVLFKGVYHYLPWILGGFAILVLCVAWMIYRQMRASASQIRDILSVPEFRNRNLEISVMGGMAKVKISAETSPDRLLEGPGPRHETPPNLLEMDKFHP